jgi:hypothetical protein
MKVVIGKQEKGMSKHTVSFVAVMTTKQVAILLHPLRIRQAQDPRYAGGVDSFEVPCTSLAYQSG